MSASFVGADPTRLQPRNWAVLGTRSGAWTGGAWPRDYLPLLHQHPPHPTLDTYVPSSLVRVAVRHSSLAQPCLPYFCFSSPRVCVFVLGRVESLCSSILADLLNGQTTPAAHKAMPWAANCQVSARSVPVAPPVASISAVCSPTIVITITHTHTHTTPYPTIASTLSAPSTFLRHSI